MNFWYKLMGMGGEKSDNMKLKIRDIFNEKVENGDSYNVIATYYHKYEKKLLKDVETYYNFIVGYKDGDDPELVIIPTDQKLSSIGSPIHCKKSENMPAKYDQKVGQFVFTHPELGNEPMKMGVITSTRMSYVISVSYLDEYQPFTDFITERFVK